jgi:Flp pilus assembly pilin Flp
MNLKMKRATRAQTMTEYLILVCLLAAGSIVVVTQLGDGIRAQLGAAAQRIAGQTATTKAKEQVEGIDEKVDRDLGDFWKQ